MAEVTPEMIEAAFRACPSIHLCGDDSLGKAYQAMRALDPQVEQLKARIRLLSEGIEERSLSLARLANLAISFAALSQTQSQAQEPSKCAIS